MAPMWGAQLEYGPGLRERKKQYVLGGVLGLETGLKRTQQSQELLILTLEGAGDMALLSL